MASTIPLGAKWQSVCSSKGSDPGDSSTLKSLCEEGRLDKALETLFQVDQQGSVPSVQTYRYILQACSKKRALLQAKQVLLHIKKSGMASDVFLGESVVSTLVKCGGLADAVQEFTQLSRRSVFPWNEIIAGFAKSGQGQQALRLYQQMLEEGVKPNKYTFLSLVKSCSSLGELKRIHADAFKYRCESDVFVGNTLIHKYASCGSISLACRVFDTLPDRSVVSWNAMLAGYAEQGQAEKAWELYGRMQAEGVTPNERTFVSVLKACSSLADREAGTAVSGRMLKLETLEKGRAVCDQVERTGSQSDVYVASAVVSMYASCGSIVDARNAFDALPRRDAVLWNAMIAGYADQEQGEESLQLYSRMQQEGVSPNLRTYVSLLKACSSLAANEASTRIDGQLIKVQSLEKGKALVDTVVSEGYESDVFVRSALVSMYASCGSVVDACQVFDTLSEHDVVTYNAMIAGYAEHEQGEKAVQLYYKMQEEGLRPNDRTFVSVLTACSSLADNEASKLVDGKPVKVESLKQGKAIYNDVLQGGYESDVFVGSSALHMFASCGKIEDARHIFDMLSLRNVVSWNAMIEGYAKQEQGDAALLLYAQMREGGVRPNERTFVSVLTACSSLAANEGSMLVGEESVKVEALRKGRAIHDEIVRMGYAADTFVSTSVIHMYATCGSVKEARHVFDNLSERRVVSWNAMIAGYADQEQGDEALELYARMQAYGVKPDESTFVCILRACSNSGALNICRQIYHERVEYGLEWNVLVATAFIHAYGKCGSMVDAQQVFDSLPDPDAIAWSALLAGYARQGECGKCFECFELMLQAGMEPNGVTFVSLISACSHSGMVDRGLGYFETMTRDHGISPGLDHYACMVDLLGRAGLFGKAEALLSSMPMEPDLTIWLSLLGACQKYGNVELGKQAFECSIRLEPKHSSPYVLMANIYSQAGMWERAKEIHDLRQRTGARKKPGQSWIEHEQKVHLFRVGDSTSKRVAEMLKELSSQVDCDMESKADLSVMPL